MRYKVCIQAGMQKSGTAYVYNVINEILYDKYKRTAKDLKKKNRLLKFLKGRNNNIGKATNGKLVSLLLAGVAGVPFLVKTHSPPIRLLKFFSKLGLAKVIYTYRDPRDVFVSAKDHGQRLVDTGGRTDTFAQFLNFDKGMKKLGNYLRGCKMYLSIPSALCIKYEEITTEPMAVFKRIADFLGVQLTEARLKEIIEKYDVSKKSKSSGEFHFNKGISKRYLTDLTPEEISKLNVRFEKEIQLLGYELE